MKSIKIFVFIIVLAASSLFAQSLAAPIRYLQKGDEALLAGNYKGAVTQYLKSLTYSNAKQKALLWDDLGYAYLRLGKLEEAKHYLEQVLTAAPENFDARLYLAAVYLLQEKQELAFQHLNKIKNHIYFDNSWTWKSDEMDFYHPEGRRAGEDEWRGLARERGVYLEKKGSPGERSRAFIYIDALHESNEALLHFLRGLIFASRGETEDADRSFRAARAAGYPLEIPYKIIKPDQLKSEMLTIHHRFRRHLTALLRDKLIEFQEVLETGNLSRAVSVLYQALDIDAESFHANHNLALLYLDQAQSSENRAFFFEKAERYCARALWFQSEQSIKKKDYISCLDLMANIYFQQNDFESARDEYRKILEIDPHNDTARYNLGCSFYNLRAFKEAETIWVKILDESEENQSKKAQEDQDPQIHSLTVRKASIEYLASKALGNLYFSRKEYSQAIEKLEKAVLIRPGMADPYYNLAVALAEEKHFSKAVKTMKEYLYLGGTREDRAEEYMKKWLKK
jgi:tetratricopeptide (TPR) repeat protein